MEGKGKKVMTWILGIALAGMIAGFVNLGIEVFYPSPKYETYCTPEIVENLPDVYPKQCDLDFKDAIDSYNEKVFWVLAPIGFVLVLVGIFYTSLLINLIGVFGGKCLRAIRSASVKSSLRVSSSFLDRKFNFSWLKHERNPSSNFERTVP